MNKVSKTFRFLKLLGLNYSEKEYGQVSFKNVVAKIYKTYRNGFLIKFIMESWILSPILHKKVRPWVLRKMGSKIGKNVFIGSQVWIDFGNAELIEIGDNSHVDARCILLCHKRDLSSYFVNDEYIDLPYKKGKIIIGRNCSIGTASMIMPGVIIGDGAIVGAYSLVTKDIPAWTIVTGRPTKVVKQIPPKELKR